MRKLLQFCIWHCQNRRATWVTVFLSLIGVFCLGHLLRSHDITAFEGLLRPADFKLLLSQPPNKIWRILERDLLNVLNLELSDFEFRLFYDPGLHKEDYIDLIQVGESYGWPMMAPGDVSEDLLGRLAWEDMPVWNPVTRNCEAVVFTAGDRPNGQVITGMDNPNFNRKQWAIRHDYCLVHLRCRPHRRRGDYRSAKYRNLNITTYYDSVWSSLGADSRAPHHTLNTSQCESMVDPYFWKFVGMLKLIKESDTSTKLLFLDDDVFITHQSVSIDEWEDATDFKPAQSAVADADFLVPSSDPSARKESRLVVGTDFVAFRDHPVDFLNVTLPLNTGFVYLDRSDSINAAVLAAWTLLQPFIDEEAYRESLMQFWDTDQGVFTYILNSGLGLPIRQIYEQLQSQNVTSELLSKRQAIIRGPFDSAQESLDVVVVPQRLAAGVLRSPYLSDYDRPDLTWGPGDWMLHLYPGWPSYKELGWSMITELDHPAVQSARWWTLKL